MDGLEQEFEGELAVRRVNAASGDGPDIVRAYRIPGHPTIMLFDSTGQEVRRLIGPQPVDTVADALQDIMVAAEE